MAPSTLARKRCADKHLTPWQGRHGAIALSCPRNWASAFEDFHLPSPSSGVHGQAARPPRPTRIRGLVRRALVRILRRQEWPLRGGWQSVAMHVDIGLSGLRHRHCRVVRRVPATGKISCFPIPRSAPVLLRARRISYRLDEARGLMRARPSSSLRCAQACAAGRRASPPAPRHRRCRPSTSRA